MSVQIFWRLETAGDPVIRRDHTKLRREWNAQGRSNLPAFIRDDRGSQFNNYDYLAQVARGAELTGFDGLVIPNDPAGEDPLITASVLASHATRLRIVPVFSPAFGSAVYAAKLSASFQRFSHNRLAWGLRPAAVVEGRRSQGDFIDDADLLDRLEDFLTVARGISRENPFTHKGRFFEVENGGLAAPLSGYAFPEVHLYGSDKAALEFSARHADVHIFEAEPLDRIEKLTRDLQAAGREIKTALAVNVLVRETADEAWDEARHIWSVTAGDANFETSVLGGNWWSGTGAATATLVGSYDDISAELNRYSDAGISRFILGAFPQLEEIYRVGEHILPALVAHSDTSHGQAA